jgi:hypothetical protein
MPRAKDDEAREGRRGITIAAGATDDYDVIQRRGAEYEGSFSSLSPGGEYASGAAQAMLDYVEPGRLVFSCGRRITLGVQDLYTWKLNVLVNAPAGASARPGTN